jgi:hypothetical protein
VLDEPSDKPRINIAEIDNFAPRDDRTLCRVATRPSAVLVFSGTKRVRQTTIILQSQENVGPVDHIDRQGITEFPVRFHDWRAQLAPNELVIVQTDDHMAWLFGIIVNQPQNRGSRQQASKHSQFAKSEAVRFTPLSLATQE